MSERSTSVVCTVMSGMVRIKVYTPWTALVTPVVDHWLEREIAQWVHHEGLIETTHLGLQGTL